MADRKPQNRRKPQNEDSLEKAPSQPDGVRRPSDAGVGKEYTRDPADDAGSPTVPDAPF